MLYPKIVDVLREENARLRTGRDAALVHGPEDLIRALEESKAEVEKLERDRGMLKAVHGALVDAGCRMGEIGHCEADLVREVTKRAEAAEADRDEWRDTARSEMAGRAAAEAEVARLRAALDEARATKDMHKERQEEAWAEAKRLRTALLLRGISRPPCDICGYVGEGYYQSDRHGCISDAVTHAALAPEVKP